jgi:hypothetical protein
MAQGDPIPRAANTSEELEIKVNQAGAVLGGGGLFLDDRSLAQLATVVELCRSEFRAGKISKITICGHDWCDEHVEQLVKLLLPQSSKYSTGIFAGKRGQENHLDYVQQTIPALTELEIMMCEKLTKDWGLEVGAKLWSLKKVNLVCWTTSGESWHAIMQLIRLPRLEEITFPIGLPSSCGSFPPKERDILRHFFQKRPEVTVS